MDQLERAGELILEQLENPYILAVTIFVGIVILFIIKDMVKSDK